MFNFFGQSQGFADYYTDTKAIFFDNVENGQSNIEN